MQQSKSGQTTNVQRLIIDESEFIPSLAVKPNCVYIKKSVESWQYKINWVLHKTWATSVMIILCTITAGWLFQTNNMEHKYTVSPVCFPVTSRRNDIASLKNNEILLNSWSSKQQNPDLYTVKIRDNDNIGEFILDDCLRTFVSFALTTNHD